MDEPGPADAAAADDLLSPDAGPSEGGAPDAARPPDGGAADAFVCPKACNKGCVSGVCLIECGVSLSCLGKVICPPNIPCQVSCGFQACILGVDCTAASHCKIDCGGIESCPAKVACGKGSCTVNCSGPTSCGLGVDCTQSCSCAVSCTGLLSCAPGVPLRPAPLARLLSGSGELCSRVVIWLVTAIVVLTIVLLVTEVIPVDLTALLLMVVLMVTGALTPREALAGLAHPAPVTVGALFIVSAGLGRTGALEFLSSGLIRVTQGRPRLLLLLLLLLAGLLSAFVNNTPVVLLLISVLVAASGQQPIVLSKYLMPLSFISILAGTSTLIGTSTNIIISDLAVQLGQAPLGIFELSAVGAPIAVLGGIFLFLFAFRLLPAHKTPVLSNGRETTSYLAELLLPERSALVGCRVVDGVCGAAPGLEVYEVVRGMAVLDPAERPVTLRGGDLLLAKAVTQDLIALLDRGEVRLPVGDDGVAAAPFDEGSLIVELVVPPNSGFAGRRWRESVLAAEPHIHCIGVQRRWTHYPWQKLDDLRLAVGDILLVQSPKDHLEQLRAGGELLVFDGLQQRIVNTRKAPLAAAIFLGMVALATTGIADILVAALGAAALMVALGCISLQQAYRSVDVKTLMLIAGTLALGQALQKSGAADFYAQGLLTHFQSAGPHAVLALCIALTSLLSHFLSNNSTAVLMTPVALSAAKVLGVATRPFVVGLCMGASACFATPIGYQTNLLVYGPGGYRFSDYLKLGVPLDLLVCVGASVLIPLIWPF